jgi:hypothetical protein
MHESSEERQVAVLLRISESIDIVGDVSLTVANPSELLAWATVLSGPAVFAWRGHVSGQRFVHVTAVNASAPVHGRVTVALRADDHPAFWSALIPGGDLDPGEELALVPKDLGAAWDATPIDVPE